MHAWLNDRKFEIPDEITALTLYAIGTYSSFVVEGRKVKGWGLHLQRLVRDSRDFLGLAVEPEVIEAAVNGYLDEQNPTAPMTCRVTIFPGDFTLSAPHQSEKPQLLVTGRVGSSVPSAALSLVTENCHRPFAMHKVTNIGAAMQLRGKAKANGFDDAIFIDNGLITEGPTWNIFGIRDNRIVTPILDGNLLPGVTRSLIIDAMGGKIEEVNLGFEELATWDAGFVTNAAIGAKPIDSIDGRKLDADHHLITKVQEAYAALGYETISCN